MTQITVSFEFFPPASVQATQQLWQQIRTLAPLNPAFVSVTYGAGGTTRERTHELVVAIQRELGLPSAAHLTCVGSSREDIAQIAGAYWQAGVRHIVALRGDKPKSQPYYIPHPNGYGYADALVAGLKALADFEISVAAYPETHPEAASAQADIDHLKRKIDAGATRAITQYFFDTHVYTDFLDRLAAADITVPVLPGILPIANIEQTLRFSAMCGASVPAWVQKQCAAADTDEDRKKTGIALATQQCEQLLDAGVAHLHFYTLNRADMVLEICRNLGINAAV